MLICSSGSGVSAGGFGSGPLALPSRPARAATLPSYSPRSLSARARARASSCAQAASIFPSSFSRRAISCGSFCFVRILAVVRLGLREQLAHLQPQLLAQLDRAGVGDVLVLGGAGFEVRAIEAHAAELEQLEFAGQLEHIHKRTGHRLQVVAAEGADRGSPIACRHLSRAPPPRS